MGQIPKFYTKASAADGRLFPWSYALVAPLPGVLIFVATALALHGPRIAIVPAIIFAMMTIPSCAFIVAWGRLRLARGDGERYPALHRLSLVPIWSLFAGLLLTVPL